MTFDSVCKLISRSYPNAWNEQLGKKKWSILRLTHQWQCFYWLPRRRLSAGLCPALGSSLPHCPPSRLSLKVKPSVSQAAHCLATKLLLHQGWSWPCPGSTAETSLGHSTSWFSSSLLHSETFRHISPLLERLSILALGWKDPCILCWPSESPSSIIL